MPAPKLNERTHKVLVAALEAGTFRAVAAETAGIHRATLYAWLERGEADHDANKSTMYADLYEAILKAEANAEYRALQQIQGAAVNDWRAAAWYLERRYQDRWGGKIAVEHSGKIAHDLADKSDAELQEIAAAISGRRDASTA